uniref:Uncharacterized protein n=1 Tax=Panagrolaimus sp. JU765 TaxID=591449 RepID=A0AC34RNP9_9BILA
MRISPCSYPVFIERHACGVQDSHLLNGLFCDPDSTVSMSEMQLVDDAVQVKYKKHTKCICPGKKSKQSKNQQCWYKFGFAFLREIWPIGILNELHNAEQCPFNATNPDPRPYRLPSSETVYDYGQNYARIVRERWNFGGCGEDIFFLIVQKRPDLLPKHDSESKPFIFVSYGSIVMEKLSNTVDPIMMTIPIDPMRRLVDEANNHLADGYPLNRVLTNLINKISDFLVKSENHNKMPLHKDHIPFWAWMTFATCGVLCILMGIGLCLLRTTTRRGSQRGKQIIDPGRRWKAGFVGGMWYEL